MFTQRITTRINLLIKIIYKVDPANHTIECTQKNLSNKDETTNHEEKGQKHIFLTTCHSKNMSLVTGSAADYYTNNDDSTSI